MSEPIRLVVAGGGTAGHISPMLAIADAIVAQQPQAQITALGTAQGLETRLVPEAGYKLELIPKVPMPRSISLDMFKFPFAFIKAVRESTRVLRQEKAQGLIGVGGYVCTPAYLAAKRMGLPIFVHEANSVAGLANKIGAKHAKVVATTFTQTGLPNAEQIGMPMRSHVATMDRAALRDEARAYFGITGQEPLLVVTGGSSGALSINKAIQASLPVLAEAGIHTVHITGRGKPVLDDQGRPLAAAGYTQVEYVDRMDYAYAAADLMICRSGAGTVCELAVAAVPSILVPLPIGNGEQKRNARELVAAGGALLVEDRDFTLDYVTQTVVPLLGNRPRLEQMSLAAASQGRSDAAEVMARKVIGQFAAGNRASTEEGK
ncbi:undecaprenyldiphospho-muramoylpentapeptide beta-N-acetylglucosaminyltransferase [Glutamicibacter sp. MNS18]|uniref:undecaprenyldiphospho-muramoylpentapeptide beta-N-acetylglucosaminyltransferase n=1 Tax=Glutamicibacter sp. MNS18 TaxID=2989817 RepID=UPI002235614D|nr:undecaprenyldiphospho-muramoylpentapeptide beta-N-acetylglucosaminyltransferase [Glutamicibacter sp. MNS18]MCW4464418.1 undecaprenyldiphospho-muramoylpentapeptide beta-N-acetylglucosaminyltransferase [Glutamicibacter sp. MNS18]